MQIVIIGGGIIGLSCAWRLARRGMQVTICDANSESREASWAAAGMLAPHNEAHQADDLWALCCASFKQWPYFINDLGLELSDVDYRAQGSLEPILPGDDVQELEEKAAALAHAGADLHWLRGDALRQAEPLLSHDVERALWMQGGHVDPRRVCNALRQRCRELGVELRYQQSVQEISDSAVLLSDGTALPCDQAVLAAGAWTPALSTLSGFELRGEPVKGQMLSFATSKPLLQQFVHCRHAYLVERRGTGIVVGSTMEYLGFDRSDSQAAIAQLAAGAQHVLPELKTCPIAETWTGLRPKLNGGLPVFKRLNERLCLATGHFRNGILLTPITASIIEAIVCNDEMPHPIDAFDGAESLSAVSAS